MVLFASSGGLHSAGAESGENGMGLRGTSVCLAGCDTVEQGPHVNDSRLIFIGLAVVFLVSRTVAAADKKARLPAAHPYRDTVSVEALRLAIADLVKTHGPRYSGGAAYLRELDVLAQQQKRAGPEARAEVQRRLRGLRQKALLANPLLGFERLLVLKRKRGQLGLPTNHQCNTALKRNGYDNEIAVLSPVGPGGKLQTLFRPRNGAYVGEFDLHWHADRLLFTMPVGPTWQIHEIAIDGTGCRQVSNGKDADVDNFDACYLPDGRIVFASTACYTGVPCWHGKERACSLYRMNADGTGMRQLCFDQDLDLHPAVLPTGQVVFSRWDYTGIMHMYLRPLMAMNPDGTGQRAIYGSNSYWPNCLFFPRAVPGAPGRMIAVLTGYHGSNREGQLALLDLGRGYRSEEGVAQLIPGRGKKITPVIKDHLTQHAWPKFLHPHPLSDPSDGLGAGRHFLVSMKPGKTDAWGIYLVDVFDNIVPVCVDSKADFFEPIPIMKRPVPPVIPDRTDLGKKDAVVYIHSVYEGPGLAGVPRGTIKRLRVASYHYGYPGLAGPDKIGCGGPWEAMRIIGTVPVYEDGSVSFVAPANTPLTLQPLDAEGKAVQLMRSWYTAMPGEKVSCVGCHERPNAIVPSTVHIASQRTPDPIEPWYGPPRGFDFQREVQPVLDAYCVSCHDGTKPRRPDLRTEKRVKGYQGRPLNRLGSQRLHPELKTRFGGTKIKYTPAYEALVSFIRRVGVEDDVNLLVPGEYHADTSELIQMLRKGHHGVQLDPEAWDRLVTWIDLNGPCHGTWTDIAPIPGKSDARRRELAARYGAPPRDPEAVPDVPRPVFKVAGRPREPGKPRSPSLDGWPFGPDEARRRQAALGPAEKTVDLGGGVTLKLARIPAGSFVMGDVNGCPDERAATAVQVRRPFWIGALEVTNEQFRRFTPNHVSGYFMKRYPGIDGPGLDLNGPRHPAVRVSWLQAMAFCQWLSGETGLAFSLPTEAQWEYACRSGSGAAFSFGPPDADFSSFANLADRRMSLHPCVTGGVDSSITAFKGNGIFQESLDGGDVVCDSRYDDGMIPTAKVGNYRPNAWGLHDMHGNAAEWTRSAYGEYPYSGEKGRNSARRTVRGGSFRDRPKRARSGFRLAFPEWQRVHNVGFRVVCEEPGGLP